MQCTGRNIKDCVKDLGEGGSVSSKSIGQASFPLHQGEDGGGKFQIRLTDLRKISNSIGKGDWQSSKLSSHPLNCNTKFRSGDNVSGRYECIPGNLFGTKQERKLKDISQRFMQKEPGI